MTCFFSRPGISVPLRAVLCVLTLAAAFTPSPCPAANSRGLVVTPLDEGGEAAAAVGPDGSFPAAPSAGGVVTQTAPGSAPDGGEPRMFPEKPSYKEGIVMAYLVELMRKQNRPCPSGALPPAPPSLLFSEPLCRVAEAVGKGAAFPVAYEEQGIYAARWRMFSATDLPAQTVATRLRAEHCEALMEPYTHIGAWRDASGWRIVLATLTEKPEPELIVPGTPDLPGADGAVPPPAAAPGTAQEPAISGQEARALFSLLNDLRVTGGACLGQPATTAPPLAFNAALQEAAEREAADAAEKNTFGYALGGSPPRGSGAAGYAGAEIARLAASSRSPAKALLDVWMVSPTRCATLLSPEFQDAGAAYVDGHWILLLGRRTVP